MKGKEVNGKVGLNLNIQKTMIMASGPITSWQIDGRSEEHTSELQSPAAVILEPKKTKSDTVSTVSPSISHEVMGPDAMIFIFWMLSF